MIKQQTTHIWVLLLFVDFIKSSKADYCSHYSTSLLLLLFRHSECLWMCLDYPICSLSLIPAEAYVSPRRSYCVYCVRFAGRPRSDVVILVQSVAVADTEPEIPSDSPRVTRETVQRARSTWPDQYMSGTVVLITDLREFNSHNNKHSRCFSGNSKRRKLLVRRHNSAQRDQILVHGCPGIPDAQKSHRDAKFWHAWCPLDAHS